MVSKDTTKNRYTLKYGLIVFNSFLDGLTNFLENYEVKSTEFWY